MPFRWQFLLFSLGIKTIRISLRGTDHDSGLTLICNLAVYLSHFWNQQHVHPIIWTEFTGSQTWMSYTHAHVHTHTEQYWTVFSWFSMCVLAGIWLITQSTACCHSYRYHSTNTEHGEQRWHFIWSGFHFQSTALITVCIRFLVKITSEIYISTQAEWNKVFHYQQVLQSHGQKQAKWNYKEKSHAAAPATVTSHKTYC